MSLQSRKTLLPRLVIALGVAAALGLLAQPASSATWQAIELNSGSRGSVVTEDGSLAPFDARIQRSVSGDGIALLRVMSNTMLNPPSRADATGSLAFDVEIGDRFLFRPVPPSVDGQAKSHAALSITFVGALGKAIDDLLFSIFQADAGGNASGSAIASLKGSGSLSAVLRGDALFMLNVAGVQVADLEPALGKGSTVIGGFDAFTRVVPLPPAIVGFLTGLGALFAFRRTRREPSGKLVR